MRESLIHLVETAELAVASSSGVVSQETLEPLVNLLKTIRLRMSFPEDVLVVALAGGTGSGKSSLLNALAGDELVDVGGVRPTTSEPAASVPRSAGSRFEGFLDRIGVNHRHNHDDLAFCLIDLPDNDSVEVAHHHRVDELLPVVDVVVWVTDPEKYRDSRLHHDYLQPLSENAERFVVVLNQIDRLAPDDLEAVLTDLGDALESDGIPKDVLVPMAVTPPAGPGIGIEELVSRLESMRAGRDLVAAKLIADLAATARSLAAGAGEPLDFDVRASSALSDATASLEEGDRASAISRLTAFLDEVAAEVGGPSGREIARMSADVPAHVGRIDSEMRSGESRRRWFQRRREPEFDGDAARSSLNEAMIRPARAIVARRAVALASIADLAVEVESLGRDLSR